MRGRHGDLMRSAEPIRFAHQVCQPAGACASEFRIHPYLARIADTGLLYVLFLGGQDGPLYSSTSAVILAEILKMFGSVCLLFYQERGVLAGLKVKCELGG